MLEIMLAAMMATAPTPTAEAEALGRRLAAAGALASIAPLLVEKDLADLAGEDPSLTAADRATLLEIGREEGRQGTERLTAALGHAYASRLTVPELKQLVAQNESAAARRLRAIMAPSVAETMAAIGQVDLKKDTVAAFCKRTGRTTGKTCGRR